MVSRKIDLKRVANVAVVFAIVLAVVAAVTGIGDAASVLAGAAVMVANYHLIRMLVSQLIMPRLSKGWTLLWFTLKFVLFFALVAGAFYRLPISPVSFAVGASQLLVGAVLEALFLGEPVSSPADDGTTID